jgi:hypothetical protein
MEHLRRRSIIQAIQMQVQQNITEIIPIKLKYEQHLQIIKLLSPFSVNIISHLNITYMWGEL